MRKKEKDRRKTKKRGGNGEKGRMEKRGEKRRH